eukprot:scaffold7987_cov87-Skeletonema_marinoi.AAC.1
MVEDASSLPSSATVTNAPTLLDAVKSLIDTVSTTTSPRLRSTAVTLRRIEFSMIPSLNDRPCNSVSGSSTTFLSVCERKSTSDRTSNFEPNEPRAGTRNSLDCTSHRMCGVDESHFSAKKKKSVDYLFRRQVCSCGSSRCHCNSNNLRAYWEAAQLLSLVMPSSGAAERVFSLLNNHFMNIRLEVS